MNKPAWAVMIGLGFLLSAGSYYVYRLDGRQQAEQAAAFDAHVYHRHAIAICCRSVE